MSYHIRDKILCAFTVVVLFLSSLSYYIFQAHDPTRCQVLLQDGFWLNPSELRNWQPPGCMMRTYEAKDVAACLPNRYILFLGGQDTFYIYNALAKKMDPSYEPPSEFNEKTRIVHEVSDVRFAYLNDPNLDSQQLKEAARKFNQDHGRPALTVIGLDFAHVQHEESLSLWAEHVRALMSDKQNEGRMMGTDRVVVAPILIPDRIDDTLSQSRIDRMHEVLSGLNVRFGVDLAYSFDKVARTPDGLAQIPDPIERISITLADLLLNLRCNAELPKHYPYASTCCNSYPNATWVQTLGFLFIALLVPIAMFCHHRGYLDNPSALARWVPSSSHLNSILIMGLAAVLCYYCDRTNILSKEQKQTSPFQFLFLFSIIVLGSLYTLKTSDKELEFLNRDQTDEWKGWMQIAILIYHYVGVSKTAYIYENIRVLIASYLFMTGFGHTIYFLKKDDFSFKRFVATMLRLNLLNVILAYAMGTDWLLYYFAPLVTWNFCVIYGIYRFRRELNGDRRFVYMKMAIGAMLNMGFYHIPGVLEFFWSIFAFLLRMEGDMREWRFRVTLDQFAIFPGMITGIMYLDWDSFVAPKSPSWPLIQKVGIVACSLVLLGYAIFESYQPNKFLYNYRHAYISWLPCCAYVLLRNATPTLRRSHIALFAWVGRGALETFILQFHIWLAADTRGLLVIGPPYLRLLNFLITTVCFLWVASLVTGATGGVIEWIMGVQSKSSPSSLPAQGGQGAENDEKNTVSLSDNSDSEGAVSSALPVNGAPTELSESVSKEAQPDGEPVLISSRWAGVLRASDLRVRIGVILGLMAFLNWTYHL